MYSPGVSEILQRFTGEWKIPEDFGFWKNFYEDMEVELAGPDLGWAARELYLGRVQDGEFGIDLKDIKLPSSNLSDLERPDIYPNRFFSISDRALPAQEVEATSSTGGFGGSFTVRVNGEVFTPALYTYGENGGVAGVITQLHYLWDDDILLNGEFDVGLSYYNSASAASGQFVVEAFWNVASVGDVSGMGPNDMAAQLATTLTTQISLTAVASYGVLSQEEYEALLEERRLEMEEMQEAIENGEVPEGPQPGDTVTVYSHNGEEGEASFELDLSLYLRTQSPNPIDGKVDPEADVGTLDVGGNTAINTASIVDGPETYGSAMIHGDYYDINVIAQINILHDGDMVPDTYWNVQDQSSEQFISSLAQQQTIVSSMVSAGTTSSASNTNTMDNFARFDDVVEAPAPTEAPILEVGAGASNALWTIDYAYGDYYDALRFTQINHIVDNDVVGQIEITDKMSIVVGNNYAQNSASFLELSTNYDLIIVGGDYYETSYIYQKNIIYDADYMQGMGQAFDDDGISSSTSGNTLINSASIGDAGTPIAFDFMTENAAELSSLIQAGETELDPLLTSMFAGNGGGTFSVLYVTGNYYDTKAIFQTNIIEDADAVAVASSTSVDTDVTVSLGGNTTINTASIIEYDSASELKMLEGDHYEESFLMQANLLPEDLENEEAMDALASEVVVFAVEGSKEETVTGSDAEIVKPDASSDDMLASVLA
ncbi:hypothetical protein [Pseudovibrio sp. SPO723]|uniref:hypothetical protein n=1 Tax=Nesiotobacter zosterae TaxID=392721 RepID=UPI0029C451F5|nr:hypothetical protein [Pseudovibrio sp. SPO723]MDX5593160.1 hypothetical protein [Pseudovibrio sp. SPO723]